MLLAMSIPGQTHQFTMPRPPNGSSELPPKEHELSSLLLHQCRGMEDFKQIHAQFIKLDLDRSSRYASAVLKVCALSDWGSMEYARKVFQRIDDPTSFEFNTLVRGFVKQGPGNDPKEAILLYREMHEDGVCPDDYTFPFVLKACSQIPALREGTQIHGHVFKFGHQIDQIAQNSLINMYGKCGEIEKSLLIFEQMGDEDKDITSWNSLLASYTRLGLWRECLELFSEMPSKGWRPNESTLVSLLNSCTHLGMADLGRRAHGFLLRNMGELNMITSTALIDMYVKCGCLDKGLDIFRRMPEKNAWTYSVMISGLAMHGEGEKALWLFRDMVEDGLEPDEAVCVGVLAACSHAGLLAEGLRFFDRMRFEHGLNPTLRHYSCMVDLMGRAGKLQQAYEFILSMPIEPDDSVWRNFLSACKVHHDLEFAEIAKRNLLHLDPHTSGDYILMANIYSRAEKWEEAAKVRTEMVNRQLQQTPGLSMVEVNKELHTFVSHDKTHAESKEIYGMLYQMEWQLRFEGYSPDLTQVLHCVDEDEKLKELAGHSQKLAIAYALISTDDTKQIKIFRNLRMCGDCHTYTKLISKIFNREVIVRDRKRFHHFRDGVCSCRDYW